MQNSGKGWKKVLALLGIVLLIQLVFLSLIPGCRFYFHGDETEEVIPMVMHFYRTIRSGSLGFWDWTSGFGISNAIHLFTFLGSPGLLVMLALPKVTDLFHCFYILMCAAVLLTGFFGYFWLSRIVRSEKARIAGALIMAFSGWMMYWMHFYNYQEAWVYLTILLYSMECLMDGEKKWLFPLMIFLILLLDLYFFYMTSWLILFYLITRLRMKQGKLTFRALLKDLREPFLLYLLGIGIGAFILIPEAYELLSAGRVSSNIPKLLKDPSNLLINRHGLFRLLTALFSPVGNDYDYNLFSTPFDEKSMHTYALYIYSFMLYPLLLPQIRTISFSGKNALLQMLGILCFFALVPDFYILLNGNITSRWCFFFSVFQVILTAEILDQENQMDLVLLKKSCAGVIVLLVIFSLIAWFGNSASKMNQKGILWIVPCQILLVFGYEKTLSQETWKKRFPMTILAECLLVCACRLINGTSLTLKHGDAAEQYENAVADTEVYNRIQSQDAGFFRMVTDDPAAEGYLVPMAKNFRSVSFYNGVYNRANDRYYDRRITGSWFIPYCPSKFLSYSMFGVKYLVTWRSDSFVPFGYRKIMEYDQNWYEPGTPVCVYENELDMGLGFASTRTWSEADSDRQDKSVQDFQILTGILTDQSENHYQENPVFHRIGAAVNNEVLDYEIREPGTLFFDYSQTKPDSKGSFELYRDGKQTLYREFQEYGFYAVHLTEKADAIGIYCRNAAYEAEQVPCNVYWISDSDLEQIYQKAQKEDRIIDAKADSFGASGDITITKKGEILATAIPYNRGWQVYVDGVKTDYQMVNTSFIGLPLSEGTHHLQFIFIPQGLKTGLCISVSCLILSVLLIFRWRR